MTARKYWPIGLAKMWSLGYFDVPVPRHGTNLYGIGGRGHEQWNAVFEDWVAERLRAFHEFHVRDPSHHWSLVHARNLGATGQNWHCDGISARYLGSWSNTFGTEIRKRDKAEWTLRPHQHPDHPGKPLYQPEPFEFVLFDNSYFEHRPPKGLTEAQQKKRWFVRLATDGPLLNHSDVKECVL